MRPVVSITLIIILLAAVGCGDSAPPPAGEGENMTLSLTSTAFEDGGNIPAKYTCDGEDISPPLEWGEPPEGTRAFALILDDPDAPSGVFTHWVMFNIPPDSRRLEEAIPAHSQLASGARQGKNSSGQTGYGGPCPPSGRPHHYQFNLYALDQPLDLKAGVSKKETTGAMRGHILAQGRLTGIYRR